VEKQREKEMEIMSQEGAELITYSW